MTELHGVVRIPRLVENGGKLAFNVLLEDGREISAECTPAVPLTVNENVSVLGSFNPEGTLVAQLIRSTAAKAPPQPPVAAEKHTALRLLLAPVLGVLVALGIHTLLAAQGDSGGGLTLFYFALSLIGAAVFSRALHWGGTWKRVWIACLLALFFGLLAGIMSKMK